MNERDIDMLLVDDDLEALERLLAAGELSLRKVDRNRRTLLHRAVSTRSTKIVKYLLRIGSDVRARNKWGMGPLSDAARATQVQAIEPLVVAGADINEQDERGMTPLHHAMIADTPETNAMLALLRRLGADPHIKNSLGDSPMKWAQRIQNRDYLKLIS